MDKETIIYIFGYYFEEKDYKKCSYSIYINNKSINNVSNIMKYPPLTKRRACFMALRCDNVHASSYLLRLVVFDNRCSGRSLPSTAVTLMRLFNSGLMFFSIFSLHEGLCDATAVPVVGVDQLLNLVLVGSSIGLLVGPNQAPRSIFLLPRY